MMDVEIEPANENDATKQQMKTPSDVPTTEKPKDTSNHKHSKPKRSSRSRTPQKKLEDSKILHVTLKKVGEELNGKEVPEEKTENRNGESPKVEIGEKTAKETSPKVGPVKETENGEPAKIEAVRESTSEVKNGILDKEQPTINDNGLKENDSTEPQKDSKKITKQDSKEIVEMDPLVISDEVDPELQFSEENSDRDSGKGSPLMTRCVTRRSYTRNIPTPKTPKLVDQETDSEKNSVVDQSEDICNLPNDIPIPKTENLNDTNDSLDTANVSTKVQASDSTRLDFSEINNSTEHDLSYLNNLRDRSLSSRRPIRGTDNYRKRVLLNTQKKSDLNMAYDEVTTGLKRKNRSMTPEETKKFRMDSPGYRNFFTSPLASLRNKFKTDVESSTPELLGYKDDRSNLHFNDNFDLAKIEDADEANKKSWCTLM